MKKRTTVRVITFLAAGLVCAGAFAIMTARRAGSMELYARAGTQRAFDELVTSVSELSNALEKSLYVTDPALESALCTQIFGRAVTAQMAMGELPYSSQELERMSGFLSRAGDYACTLARTVGGAGGYTGEELQNLTELADTASILSMNLRDMQARIMAGSLTMEEVYAAADAVGDSGGVQNAGTDGGEYSGDGDGDGAGGGGEAPLAGTALRGMEQEFPELPTLIYDGPFSEAAKSRSALALDGLPEAGEAASASAAAEFLGVDEAKLIPQGDCGGDIPCRRYEYDADSGTYTVSVTRQGGVVMSALCSCLPGRQRLSVEEGVKAAARFLAELGYQDMAESYHMAQDGIVTVNFAYETDGALCYPDLIKVGVALDSGDVVSFDAKGYLTAHHARVLPETAVSEDDAMAAVSPLLTVEGHRMAVIPSDGGEERYCHEFSCRADEDRRFLLYVNAVTGAQERILILLEDETGTLTV